MVRRFMGRNSKHVMPKSKKPKRVNGEMWPNTNQIHVEPTHKNEPLLSVVLASAAAADAGTEEEEKGKGGRVEQKRGRGSRKSPANNFDPPKPIFFSHKS
ncbi:hypothetical protein Cni_G18907 [Canna indica]|uniref:Uncharacterized protein n=1 Tax=Canna indica TaxID=4628 RepID=A0AAQ3QI63_9LILI|nr:hypothetical protein Cni_G18907 [Canna indica]